ncbi:DEAD/DEAH box helicase family protein [Catenovulum sp. SX2]|uniref:DEAD/DEAH box helicase family protein n=1 Tax=Catenovulum sp. SX2 TaxID=3398614 RepID=UPI003F844DBF
MAYQLRPYQQQAVNAAIEHFKKSPKSAVIVLPTGSGKSLVIAELAKKAKGKILVLTHVKELVEQNHAKYQSYGLTAGIFSAGLNKKQTQFKVTFASIQSVAPNLTKFREKFSLIIIDECHRIGLPSEKLVKPTEDLTSETVGKKLTGLATETAHNQYTKVLSHLQELNPNLRVLGLTATPYRLDTGWIYRYHYYGFARSEHTVQFEHCIFEQPLAVMIKQAYLTEPKLIKAATEHYDFSSLKATANGEYKPNDINQLVAKYPRVTQAICEQIYQHGQTRQGIMVFAATVEHAQEVFHYLSQFNPEQAALITGQTDNKKRDDLIEAFKQKKLKYLVNVSVLTTGFDAPHVDFIAILRPTQSVSLYQQIVGRGLRLAPNKKDCLVIDYAGNDFDLYYPEVGSVRPNKGTVPVQVPCPVCDFQNIFWGKVDADGDLIEHFGRRCWGLIQQDPPIQCNYRFVFKQCPKCQHENDIAARYCEACKQVLVDPDEQIKDALKLKDAMVIRCAGITAEIKGQALYIQYFDEDGSEIKESFNFNSKRQREVFNQEFSRRIGSGASPKQFDQLTELAPYLSMLPHPDFIIAKQDKKAKQKNWLVSTRIFDYQGNYRKANQIN